MNKSESRTKIIDHDELNHVDESSEKIKLLNKLKSRFNLEFNGLFYIILSIIILSISLTVAMVLCIFYGPPQIRPHAGISTEVIECTEVGLVICKNGGNAVDSAIGSLLCLTVVRPDIAGLGGCGSMLIHNHSSMSSEIIDFSCVAPPNPKTSIIPDGYNITDSVAIPGVLSGLSLAHKSYGKMNWTTILQFVIIKLSNGVKVTEQMKLASSRPEYYKLPIQFRLLYQDWTIGPIFKPSKNIIKILQNLQIEGPVSGISGSFSNEIIDLGFSWSGLFDTARKQMPIKALFGDFSLITAPIPSKGGLDLALSIDILNKLIPKDTKIKNSPDFYHKLLETLKVVQAFTSFLGDGDYDIENKVMSLSSIDKLIQKVNVTMTQPNEHYSPYYLQPNIESGSGTHISVIDSTNLYVSLSINIGSKYGSGIVTKSGVILNDAMRLFTPDDASYLLAQSNFNKTKSGNIAASGKRPMNQLTPLMVYNIKRKCGIRFAVGGDHGSRGTTGSLQMILSAIFLDQTFCPSKDCLDLIKAGIKPRIHVNILDSNVSNITATVFVEPSFPDNILQELINIYKHKNYIKMNSLQSLYSIGKVQYEIKGFADNRGSGEYLSF